MTQERGTVWKPHPNIYCWTDRCTQPMSLPDTTVSGLFLCCCQRTTFHMGISSLCPDLASKLIIPCTPRPHGHGPQGCWPHPSFLQPPPSLCWSHSSSEGVCRGMKGMPGCGWMWPPLPCEHRSKSRVASSPLRKQRELHILLNLPSAKSGGCKSVAVLQPLCPNDISGTCQPPLRHMVDGAS